MKNTLLPGEARQPSIFANTLLQSISWYRFGPIVVLIGGMLIRIQYCYSHDYLEFGHDAHAHVEYIRFVLKEGRIPQPDDGWEFYQPPLYYFLCAQWLKLRLAGDLTEIAGLQELKWISCICSCAVLAISLKIAHVVFEKSAYWSKMLVLAVLAVLPGLVFLAGQINNDVPAQLLMFAGIFFLINWWQTRRNRSWLFYASAIALGVLTKTNCALLIPVGVITVLAARTPGSLDKIKLICCATLLVVALSGWFVIPRSHAKSTVKDYVVSNYSRIPAQLSVRSDLVALISFDPLQVLSNPYNDSWSDSSRRQFAQEYLFRSAFLGEFDFGSRLRSLASTILATAMMLVALTVLKVRSLSPGELYRWLPVCVCFVVYYAGLICNRALYPYSVCGDFRFVTPLALCLALMVASEHNRCGTAVIRCTRALVLAFVVLNSCFLWQISR